MLRMWQTYAVVLLVGLAIILTLMPKVHSREGDDHGNHGPLKSWFDQLQSKRGLCCSFADGVKVEDVDWDTGGPNGEYRVRLYGEWVIVPDEAVIKEPNRFGPAVVWPYTNIDSNGGATQIRCFLPGAGA